MCFGSRFVPFIGFDGGRGGGKVGGGPAGFFFSNAANIFRFK